MSFRSSPSSSMPRTLALGGFLVALAACTDGTSAPVAPTPAEPAPAVLAALTCVGSAESIVCEPAARSSASRSVARAVAPGLNLDVVLGGQNTYVQLVSSNNTFDATTLRLSGTVSVRNLTTQPLGSTDGVTFDPNGIRVFFHSAPTNGVTVVNPDGVGIFTGAGQPFYRYGEILPANGANFLAKTWTFQLPSASTTFTFQVFVTGKQPDEAATSVIPPHTFTSLSQGGTAGHGCAIRTGGATYCWGSNGAGQLGTGGTAGRLLPTGLRTAARFTSLSRGEGHTCALTAAGLGYCWGENAAGQLGNGAAGGESPSFSYRPEPTAVRMPAGVTFSAVAAGRSHSCGLSGAGTVYCWGRNDFGQVGDGTTTTRIAPTLVRMPTGVTFAAVTVGDLFACALSTTGAAYCWGHNGPDGRLGDGTTAARSVPTAVLMPTGVTFSSIAAGLAHACGLTSAGIAYCWGTNGFSQLGDGTSTERFVPVQVRMPAGVTFATIAPGSVSTCALGATGIAYCWGDDSFGQLGNGTASANPTPAPVQMPAGVSFGAIGGGAYNACGLATSGVAYCWGRGGMIGDGANVMRTAPTLVSMP